MSSIVIKVTALLWGIVVCLCCAFDPVLAKEADISGLSKILSAEQVLREAFGYDDAYITRFKLIVEKTNITLDKLLLGQVDAKAEYTSEERAEIIGTLKDLVSQQFSRLKPVAHPTYTACAGAPGVGKTFALEQMFGINVANGEFPKNAVYIGPDSVVLSQMRVHLKDCQEIGNAQAYTKWRDASNYIANFMLVKAMVDKVNIVHDTTATNIRMKTILSTLQNLQYTSHMHLYIADKDAREKALIRRKERAGYTMVTAADVISKVETAYERLADHFYEGLVDLMILYAQKGEFWLGKGDTVAFAVYNPKENPNIQILPGGQKHVNHILLQANEKENLKPELQAAFNDSVKTWVVHR